MPWLPALESYGFHKTLHKIRAPGFLDLIITRCKTAVIPSALYRDNFITLYRDIFITLYRDIYNEKMRPQQQQHLRVLGEKKCYYVLKESGESIFKSVLPCQII